MSDLGASAFPKPARPFSQRTVPIPDDGAALRPPIADSWPHTPRLLPWAIAGFLVMLWLVPFDAISLPSLPAPVEPTLDRLLLIVMIGLWLSWFLVARARGNLRARTTSIDAAMALLLIVAVLSVVLNAQTLLVLDELELSIKKIAILASFVVFFHVVATGLRPSELGAFRTLLVVLATLTALGVIYEYRSGANVFYDWSDRLLPGIFTVSPAPIDPQFGRELITGPTAHAIAVATMLAMALPFAFTGYMESATGRQRFWHAVAITLMLAGCIATVRRTGALGPAAALLVLILYRPRQMVRLLPLGVLVVMATQVLAPDAPSRVKAQFVNFSSDRSVEGRTDDYDPVKADILHAPILGRGYGSYDPAQHRFLDNEWLGRLIETGVVGAIAYLLLILAVIRVAHRSARAKDPVSTAIGISVVGAAAVYAVTSFVFDALAFPQAPYMLLFGAALATVALDRRPDAFANQRAQPAPATRARVVRQRATPARERTPAHDPNQPEISVVIVTHNGREKALATLRSARQAVGTARAEWFVVDCGSTDGTPEAIRRRFPDVTLFREPNLGFAAGNNVAFPHARGRYVLLLNPDVEVVKGTLSDLVAALDKRPDVAAASVVQRSPDGDLLPSIGRFPTTARQFGEALALGWIPGLDRLQEMDNRPGRYNHEVSVDWVVGAFLVLRAEALEEIGGLDERFFMYSEEKDWCYRIRQAGWDVRHLPMMEIVHHTGGYEGPGRLGQLTHSKLLFAEKHYGRSGRIGIRVGAVLGHALRAAVLSMSPVSRHRRRARHEAQACRTALRRTPPPLHSIIRDAEEHWVAAAPGDVAR